MDQPVRIDNPIQSDVRSELIIIPVCSDLHTFFPSQSTRLMTTDLKAAHHVLFNTYDYPKPEVVRKIMRGLFGSGAFLLYKLGDTLMRLTILYRNSNC